MPAADPSTLWSRYQHLPSPEKTVLRLKALIGGPTTKTLFAAAMAATNTRAPDGKAWSLKALNPLLDDFKAKKLRSYVAAATKSGLQDTPGMRSITPSFQEDTGYGRTACRCRFEGQAG